MKKRIIITGITNMKEGNVCISGYDLSAGEYVRPLLPGSQIPESFLALYDKVIALGSTLDLDCCPVPAARPPHIEDNSFEPNSVKVIASMSQTQYQDFIRSIADENVESIFGYEIDFHRGQPILPKGAGERSLGAIVCRECRVYVDHNDKTRCDLIDGSGCEYRHLPVVGRDEWVRQPGTHANIPVRLSLSRLFQKDDQSEPAFWMQISGVIVPE